MSDDEKPRWEYTPEGIARLATLSDVAHAKDLMERHQTDMLEVIESLRARIVELEAALAIAHGTLAAAEPEDDQPMVIHHDAPGNAPR